MFYRFFFYSCNSNENILKVIFICLKLFLYYFDNIDVFSSIEALYFQMLVGQSYNIFVLIKLYAYWNKWNMIRSSQLVGSDQLVWSNQLSFLIVEDFLYIFFNIFDILIFVRNIDIFGHFTLFGANMELDRKYGVQ